MNPCKLKEIKIKIKQRIFYLNGFIPVCSYSCDFSCWCFLNFFEQTGHENGVSAPVQLSFVFVFPWDALSTKQIVLVEDFLQSKKQIYKRQLIHDVKIQNKSIRNSELEIRPKITDTTTIIARWDFLLVVKWKNVWTEKIRIQFVRVL